MTKTNPLGALLLLVTLLPLLFRPVAVAPAWMLVLNLLLLPLCAAAGAWVVISRSTWGLVTAMSILLLSPVLANPIFDVVVLVAAATVVMRSVQACVSGSAPFSLRS